MEIGPVWINFLILSVYSISAYDINVYVYAIFVANDKLKSNYFHISYLSS